MPMMLRASAWAVLPWLPVVAGAGTPSPTAPVPEPSPELKSAPAPAPAKPAPTPVATLAGKLGPGFRVVEDAPFVLVGDLAPAKLEQIRRDVIRRSAGAMWAGWFAKRPADPVRIVVFADATAWRAGRAALLGDGAAGQAGCWSPAERLLIADLSAGTATLVHELTHALMEADFPEAPAWYGEGLACLAESARLEQGRLRGVVDERMPLLQRLSAAGRLPDLGRLVSQPDARFHERDAATNYAVARAACLWMQERGTLHRFHKRFRESVEADPTGLAALMEATGSRTAEELQARFAAWLATVKPAKDGG